MTKQSDKPDAAEYVLGLSDDDELAAAEHALASDRDFAAEVADWATRLSPLDDGQETTAPEALWSGIEARVQEADAAPGIRTVQPDAGNWECIAPGVERRIVHQDSSSRTLCYFIRLRAGAVIPEHDHTGDEHCIVLEGTLRLGDTIFGAGSYQFAAQGQPHPPVTAESPAMIFIQGRY